MFARVPVFALTPYGVKLNLVPTADIPELEFIQQQGDFQFAITSYVHTDIL
jgi:hypothetical protein